MTIQCEHCAAIFDEEEAETVSRPIFGNGYTEPAGFSHTEFYNYCPFCGYMIEMIEWEGESDE